MQEQISLTDVDDTIKALYEKAGVALFVLDKAFEVIWTNSDHRCALHHIPHAVGAFCYRVVRGQDGTCGSDCPRRVPTRPGAGFYRETADDAETIYHVTVEPRLNPAGEQSGYIVIQQDVTAWKKQDDFWHRQANRQYLLHLAGGFAHEINNPLTVLSGLLQELCRQSGQSEEQHQDFLTMQKACDRIQEYVQRVRMFSAEEAKEDLTGDLSEIFARALGLFQEFLRIKGIRIEYDLRGPWPPLAIKNALFAKIVFNLVHYIADSVQPGSVIQIRIIAPAGSRLFQVSFSSDAFISIPAQLSDLFLPYGPPDGLDMVHSIGLNTVHDLVLGHRGNLRVEQCSPSGLAFHLELPVRRARLQ